MNKSKRLICLIFIVLFMNDICQYIKAFMKSKEISVDRITLFVGSVGGHSVLHFSIIFFLIVVIFYFFANFFKREEY